MSDLSTITKLNNKNYDLWSYKLKLYLMKENLWAVVDKNVPTLPDSIWNEQNNKAMALIGLSIEDNQLIHVKKLSTAHEYWCALKTYHEKSGLLNRVQLFKKLSKMELQRNQKMEDHINDMLNIIEKLSTMGLNLNNNIVIALLLASLPSNYNSLITGLEGRPEDELTVDLIKEKFLLEFNRRKDREDSSIVREECNYCHKPGHSVNNCRTLQLKKPGNDETKGIETKGAGEKDATKKNSRKKK